ncbi:MAG: hypothetical protein EOP49_12990 [Sphingobacteriales bacterium]|nr:MAG: hypothetical protein EOP49_12990 [Sphingobacteriales bacterium]
MQTNQNLNRPGTERTGMPGQEQLQEQQQGQQGLQELEEVGLEEGMEEERLGGREQSERLGPDRSDRRL